MGALRIDGGRGGSARTSRPVIVSKRALNEARKDSHADITQWFYFRLQGAQGEACTIRLLNAGASAYPDGWVDYQAMASYDRVNWFRARRVHSA